MKTRLFIPLSADKAHMQDAYRVAWLLEKKQLSYALLGAHSSQILQAGIYRQEEGIGRQEFEEIYASLPVNEFSQAWVGVDSGRVLLLPSVLAHTTADGKLYETIYNLYPGEVLKQHALPDDRHCLFPVKTGSLQLLEQKMPATDWLDASACLTALYTRSDINSFACTFFVQVKEEGILLTSFSSSTLQWQRYLAEGHPRDVLYFLSNLLQEQQLEASGVQIRIHGDEGGQALVMRELQPYFPEIVSWSVTEWPGLPSTLSTDERNWLTPLIALLVCVS